MSGGAGVDGVGTRPIVSEAVAQPAPRTRRTVLLLLLALWAITACTALFFVRWGSSTVEVAHERLTQRIERLRAARWTRPVLRGEPVEGDALEAQFAAERGLPHVKPNMWADFDASALTGAPIGGKLGALVAANGPKLDALRAAAQRSWAQRAVDPEENEHAGKEARLQRGWRLLLVRASNGPPVECLETCADVIRLAHDAEMSGGLVGAVLGAGAAEMVAPFAMRCAGMATEDERARAIGEFRQLANDVVPIGRALDFEEVRAAVHVDTEIVTPHGLLRLLTRKRYIDALDLLLSGERGWSDWEELRGDAYGASLERVKGRVAQLKANGVLAGADFLGAGYFESVARGIGFERALVVAMTGAGAGGGGGPESAEVKAALAEEGLRDPFGDGDSQFVVEAAAGEGEWRVVSFGADRERTRASSARGGDGGTGRDVVVEVKSR